MSFPPEVRETPEQLVTRMAKAGRAAQRVLARLDHDAKAAALQAAARALRADSAAVLAANAEDLAAGRAAGLTPAMLDRLMLDPVRLESIAAAVEAGEEPGHGQTHHRTGVEPERAGELQGGIFHGKSQGRRRQRV